MHQRIRRRALRALAGIAILGQAWGTQAWGTPSSAAEPLPAVKGAATRGALTPPSSDRELLSDGSYRYQMPPIASPDSHAVQAAHLAVPRPVAALQTDPDPVTDVAGPPVPDMEEEEADSIEDLTARLAALESYREELEKAELKKKGRSSWKMGGRIHFDYWNFLEDSRGIDFFENPNPADPAFGADPADRILFRRIRLEFAGEVPDNMIFRIQVDFNNPSEPEYKDVYLGWTNLPNNQSLLLGNQKRPLGLDHLNSSRFNVFAERPLAVEAFNEDARRIGLAMYGHTDDTSVNWRYGIYNLGNTSTTGRYIGDSMQLGGYGRLAMSPWYDETSGGRGFYHFALAGAVAKPDGDATAADRNRNEARFRTRPLARSDRRWIDTGRIAGADWYEILAVESMLNLGAWQFTGEYFTNWTQREDVAVSDELFFHGGYVYASYFLTGESMNYERTSGTLARLRPFENFFLVERCRGGRGMGWGAWQVALRYDHLDLTDSNIQGGVQDSVTAGLNWHWTPYSKLQTNLIYGDIEDHRPVAGFTSGDFWILGMRFQIDF